MSRVCLVAKESVLLTAAEIEKWCRQSMLLSRGVCEGFKLTL